MTHPFDEIDVEAAAKAVGDNTHCDVPNGCPICTDIANAALSAAFKSARERGMARDGKGYHDADGADAWDATTGGFAEPGGFPVTIIRHKGE
jgi:hypothetical protein